MTMRRLSDTYRGRWIIRRFEVHLVDLPPFTQHFEAVSNCTILCAIVYLQDIRLKQKNNIVILKKVLSKLKNWLCPISVEFVP